MPTAARRGDRRLACGILIMIQQRLLATVYEAFLVGEDTGVDLEPGCSPAITGLLVRTIATRATLFNLTFMYCALYL